MNFVPTTLTPINQQSATVKNSTTTPSAKPATMGGSKNPVTASAGFLPPKNSVPQNSGIKNSVPQNGNKQKPKRLIKTKIPIVAKLVVVSLALMLVATITIALQSSQYIESGSRDRESNNNGVQAKMIAATIEQLFNSIFYKAKVIGGILFKNYSSPEERSQALELSFTTDDTIFGVHIYEMTPEGVIEKYKIIKEDFLKEHSITEADLTNNKDKIGFKVASIFRTEDRVILNSSMPSGLLMLTAALPFAKDDSGRITHVAVIDLKLSGLLKYFPEVDTRTLFMFDKSGVIIAHPDESWVANRKDLWSHPLVDKAKNNTQANNASLNFIDPETEVKYAGAYYKVRGYDLFVVSQAKEEVILEPAKEIKRKAIEITGYVVSASIFLIFLFSITITNPIESLLEFSNEVAKGNFDIHAKIKSSDEVGELSAAFNEMVDGLKERDKIKNVMNKFHGSTVTDDLLKGDLNLGGKKKEVTVFFSDIRGFTKFSEGHTPEEVVAMLNEYFQIMVGIITKNHGIVDKFVGDAIMAIWGAPNTTGEDPKHAVKACLEMRTALDELNKKRIARGHSEIKIGMGLHSGPAISGTIGSTERMEYTVIGDTVNMASRIESSTKAFGSDLLVSEATLAGLEDKFIFALAGEAEVKGQAEPIKMFRVKGYFTETGTPVEISTKYSDYEAEGADKVKITA